VSNAERPSNAGLYVVLLTAVVACLYGAYEFEALFRSYRHQPFWGLDFKGAYLVESAIFLAGDYGALWNHTANQQWQAQHGYPQLFDNNPYPPLMGVFFMPLVPLGIPLATDLWAVLQVAMTMVLGCGLGWWMLADHPARIKAGVALLFGTHLLLSAPSQIGLIHGQTGVLLTLLCAVFALAYYHGRPFLAAAALSLAISLKLYPAAQLVPVVARRDWKTVGATLAGCVAWNALVFLFVGNSFWQIYWGWCTDVLPLMPFTPMQIFTDQSFSAVFSRYAGSSGRVLGTLVGLVLIGISAWHCRSLNTPRRLALGLALGCFVQLLCVGRSWHLYHSTVWLAAALFARSQSDLRGWQTTVFALLLFPLALWESDVARSAFMFRCWTMDSGLYCALMAAMWALCVGELRKDEGR
jgi:hypothetical protein